jgi:hypothetical protein
VRHDLRRALLLAPLTFAACAPALYRQGRRVQLRGTVVSGVDAAPLGGAQVLLAWLRGETMIAIPTTTNTDEQGRFSLELAVPTPVSCRELILQVQRPGYELVRTAEGAVACESTCQRVAVEMTPHVTLDNKAEPGRGFRIGPC